MFHKFFSSDGATLSFLLLFSASPHLRVLVFMLFPWMLAIGRAMAQLIASTDEQA
jgi:hypothetical protein